MSREQAKGSENSHMPYRESTVTTPAKSGGKEAGVDPARVQGPEGALR